MVFGNDNKLRHLPFFEEAALHEEHEAEWRAATAGLVVLRLFDAWLEEGASAIAPDSWSVRAVRTAIDEMDAGTPTRAILGSIVDAMQIAATASPRDIVPRLMAYGRALEYDAKWALGIDVYETVIANAHPIEESDTVIIAQLQRGVCLRTLGMFDCARDAYAVAGRLAEQVGDMMGILRAKIGDAIVSMTRGNLPYADAAFESVASDAAVLGHPDQQAMALDGRAVIAGVRGDYELSVRFAYDALRLSGDSVERDRILSNIGTAFHMLGIRSAARDAFLVLSVTAQEQYMRWSSQLSLMTIAAEDGSEPTFEQLRRSLASAPMPPDLKTDYYIHLGRAHREFSRDDLAQIAFAKAIQLAEHYSLSRLLFEAETALQAGYSRSGSRAYEALPSEVASIAEAVREMREFAMARR